MKPRQADVLVHIDELMSPSRRDSVLDEIRHYEGVLAVETNDQRPHLFVIKYDADRTRSLDVLTKIKADGLHAELVGM